MGYRGVRSFVDGDCGIGLDGRRGWGWLDTEMKQEEEVIEEERGEKSGYLRG